MKKLIMLALVVISLCSMAAVTVTANGPKPSKEHDVFVARYIPEYGHTIEDVYFHGDLQPFARIDKGTYWVFLFDAVFDGKFHGTEALISDIGYSVYRSRPYWPEQYLSTTGSWIGEVAGKTGFMAHPVDGSGPTCFGWKICEPVTNYYPIVDYNGKPYHLTYCPMPSGTMIDIEVDIRPGDPEIPDASLIYYAVVTTNITVRLDAKWD